MQTAGEENRRWARVLQAHAWGGAVHRPVSWSEIKCNIHGMITTTNNEYLPLVSIEAYGLELEIIYRLVQYTLSSVVGQAGKWRNRAMELSIEGPDPSGDRGDGGEGHGGEEEKKTEYELAASKVRPVGLLAQP